MEKINKKPNRAVEINYNSYFSSSALLEGDWGGGTVYLCDWNWCSAQDKCLVELKTSSWADYLRQEKITSNTKWMFIHKGCTCSAWPSILMLTFSIILSWVSLSPAHWLHFEKPAANRGQRPDQLKCEEMTSWKKLCSETGSTTPLKGNNGSDTH